MVAHIPLGERIPLAGKLILARADLASDARSRLAGAERCQAVISVLDAKCNGVETKKASAGALEDFLQALIRLASSERTAEETPSVDLWYDTLVQAATGIACSKCCAPDQVCRGGSDFLRDAKTVDLYGLCIDPLKILFRDAKAVTDFAYSHIQGKSLDRIVLSTQLLGATAGPAAKAFHVGGSFRERSGASGEVTLFVEPKAFSSRSFLVTLYVLVHELLSHAKCGIATGTEHARLSLEFSEGWMDWIAAHVIGYVEGRCTMEGAGHCRWPDAVREGMNYHQMRIDTSAGSVENIKNRVGARAVEGLFYLFWGLNPEKGRDYAFWSVAQFSMAVNASAINDERRAALVTRVSKELGDVSTPATAAATAPAHWAVAIERYLTDKNAHKLLETLT